MIGKHQTNNFIIKLVDRTKLSTFIVLFFVGLVGCSVIYYISSKYGNGIEATYNGGNVDYLTSLYFSIVTISSLGYGDFKPVGYGRLVSVVEVIYGLLMISLIVAKIASERQSILVKLIYSSDNERRIKEFRELFFHYNETILLYIKDPFNEDKIRILIKELKRTLHSCNSYLRFHIKQGILLEVGAQRNIRGIIKLLFKIQRSSLIMAQYSRIELRKEFENISKEIIDITEFYINEDQEEEAKNIYIRIKDEHKRYNSIVNKRSINKNERIMKYEMKLTASLLCLVQECLPKKRPWKKHIHKDIASQLEISNKLAHKAISELVESEQI